MRTRKIIPVFLFFAIVPTCVLAQNLDTAAAPERGFFVAAYAIRPNFTLRVSGDEVEDQKINTSTVGTAFALGQKLYDGIGFEIEAGSLGIKIQSSNQTSQADNFNLTLGVKWPFFKSTNVDDGSTRFVAYLGTGAGFSSWSNSVDYRGERASENQTNLSYQVKLGTTFILTDRFDLDFHMKYQNLGPTGNRGPAFGLPGSVSNLECRAGVMYKFGI